MRASLLAADNVEPSMASPSKNVFGVGVVVVVESTTLDFVAKVWCLFAVAAVALADPSVVPRFRECEVAAAAADIVAGEREDYDHIETQSDELDSSSFTCVVCVLFCSVEVEAEIDGKREKNRRRTASWKATRLERLREAEQKKVGRTQQLLPHFFFKATSLKYDLNSLKAIPWYTEVYIILF